MVCIFEKNLKIPNGCLFWRLKNSLKLGKARLDPRWLKNFGEIALCRTVFEIQAFFVFCNFCEKFENSKRPPFLTGQIFFEHWVSSSLELHWDKNLVKIALSSTVFEIQAFLCFAIFAKNSKIQNGRHFLFNNFFLNWVSYPAVGPYGSKFCRNRSI